MTPNQEGRRWMLGALTLFVLVILTIKAVKAAEPQYTLTVSKRPSNEITEVKHGYPSLKQCLRARFARLMVPQPPYIWVTCSRQTFE